MPIVDVTVPDWYLFTDKTVVVVVGLRVNVSQDNKFILHYSLCPEHNVFVPNQEELYQI